MSRRRVIGKREILPDPKYGSEMLAKFVNMVMRSGKKSVAERIVYGAMDQIAVKGNEDPSYEIISTRGRGHQQLIQMLPTPVTVTKEQAKNGTVMLQCKSRLKEGEHNYSNKKSLVDFEIVVKDKEEDKV